MESIQSSLLKAMTFSYLRIMVENDILAGDILSVRLNFKIW